MPGSDRCASHLRRRIPEHLPLTSELAERLVEALRAGMPAEEAIVAVGLPQKVFDGWLKRGDPAFSHARDLVYRDFRARVEAARAEGELELVLKVADGARTDPQFALLVLERLFPERYARVTQRSMAKPVKDPAPPGEDDPLGEVLALAESRRKRRAG
jgi:hypothetical protein